MQLVEIDSLAPDPDVIARAAAVLRAGGLVAFPTETVYGLGANALDSAAVERIYRAKGRPNYNPLIVHVADEAGVRSVAREWPEVAAALAGAFWPGPLTLVVPKLPIVPDGVTAGLDTVGIRVPSHPVAHALLVAAGIPIAAPSANRSMLLSPTTAQHVLASLGAEIDMILDAGPSTVGIESTVVDLTQATPTVLRPGMISVTQLEAIVGRVDVAAALSGAAARPSPGMLDRHYSPRATLLLTEPRDFIETVRRERAGGRVVEAIATVSDESLVTVLPADAAGYAARLYAALHAMDERGCDTIVVERVPDGAEWAGVRDRLERASRR